MKESKSDIIFHPVRMKILQSLISQQLSVQQLKEYLPDVPQATLYRHLKKLSDAEVIHVVDKIPNRGTIEKIYALQPNYNEQSMSDISNMTKDEHMTLFIKFMANLLGQYEDYLEKEDYDLFKDGVSFRQVTLQLTDEEFVSIATEIGTAFSKVLHNKPSAQRKSRTFATIVIPDRN